MDENSSEGLARDLGTLFLFGAAGGLTDEQLLDRFLAGGAAAESAFEGIVRRHGPMVLGVCRRALGDVHSAEDVFQATFLVLAFRARAITRRDSVAPWLHGVASRLARKTRDRVRRRSERSCPLPEVVAPATNQDRVDLRSVIDEELGRLPEKYHRPMVLCYLEGLTQEEAARVLGWTKGTVSGRLARAKDLLRARLTRRGLAPAVGLWVLGTPSGIEAAALAVPASLIGATARAAATVAFGLAETGTVSASVIALARGGLRSMLVGRLKAVSVVLLLGALGSAVAIGHTDADDPPGPRGNAGSALGKTKVIDPPLPETARVQMGTTHLRHEAKVIQALFSPDGRTLATAGWDRAVRFWDPRTGEAIPGQDALKDESVPRSVDYSPDGKLLAVGYGDGTIQLWDVVARRERFRFKGPRRRGPGDRKALGFLAIRGIAFAPDGLTLASMSDEDNRVWLWDVATGRERRSIAFCDEKHSYYGPLVFSPDGRRLAVGMEPEAGGRGAIWICDLGNDGDSIVIRGAHGRGLSGLCFTKDSETLISGGSEEMDIPEETDIPEEIDIFEKVDIGEKGDGKAGGRPPSRYYFTRWDARDGRRRWTKEVPDAIDLGGFALTAHGASLVSSHRDRLLVWDVASGRVTRTIPIVADDVGGGATGIAITSDDRTIALLRDDHRIRLLDFASGKLMVGPAESHSAYVAAATFSPDGHTLATAGADGTIRLWDASDGVSRGCFPLIERGWARAVSISSDGRLMAAAGEDPETDSLFYGGIVRLWNLPDGRLRRQWKFDRGVSHVGLSADGRRVAVATWHSNRTWGIVKDYEPPDNTVRVFDVETGQRLAELRGHDDMITNLIFAPSGRSLVTASHDRTFRFWDLETGQQTRQLDINGHRAEGKVDRITAAAFAPDLTWAATCGLQDHRLILWDLTSGKVLRTIDAEARPGTRLAISPDGRRICAAVIRQNNPFAELDQIRLWDRSSGRELLSLTTQGKPIASLAFSPDGKSLATGMADTTTILWDLDTVIRRESDRKAIE